MFDQEFAEVGEIFVGKVQGLLLGIVELLLLTLLAWCSNSVHIVVFTRTGSIFSHLLITILLFICVPRLALFWGHVLPRPRA